MIIDICIMSAGSGSVHLHELSDALLAHWALLLSLQALHTTHNVLARHDDGVLVDLAAQDAFFINCFDSGASVASRNKTLVDLIRTELELIFVLQNEPSAPFASLR